MKKLKRNKKIKNLKFLKKYENMKTNNSKDKKLSFCVGKLK